MSANHARRHRSANSQVTYLSQRRLEKATNLIPLRDRLAATAAAYDAHGLDGASELVDQVTDLEFTIQGLAPELYEDRWPTWVERDLELAHDASIPSADCSICSLLEAQRDPWILNPGRAN